MRTLVWDSSFKRAFKRLIRKNPQLKTKIFVVLELLLENPYNPTLKAHRLKGKLDGLWALLGRIRLQNYLHFQIQG